MKNLITLLCLAFVSSAFAQNGGGNLTPMEKLEKKIKRLNRMANNGKLQALLPGEVQQLNQSLRGAIQVIRAANGGGGGGGPIANIVVEGYAQSINRPFVFQGQSTGQVFNDCVSQMDRTNIGKVDLIYTVVNGNPVKRNYKQQGYWTTTDQFCSVIERKAIEEANTYGQNFFMDIRAKVHSKQLNFTANTMGQAWLTCVSNLRSYNQADEIFLSVNGSRRERYYKQQGYWTGVFQICQVISNKIPQHL